MRVLHLKLAMVACCAAYSFAAQHAHAEQTNIYIGMFVQARPGLSVKWPIGNYGAAHVAFSGSYKHQATLDVDWQVSPSKDSSFRAHPSPLWTVLPYLGAGVRQVADHESGRQESFAFRAPVGVELYQTQYRVRGFADAAYISAINSNRESSAWSARIGIRAAL